MQLAKANAGQDRAPMPDVTRQRDQAQMRDRQQARTELDRASRDHAFKGAGSPQARPQIDRGVKAQQSMQQRPMARPQARPGQMPAGRPQGRPQANVRR